MKCDGTGSIRAFGHVAGGRCFSCGGSGTVRAANGWRGPVTAAGHPYSCECYRCDSGHPYYVATVPA
jgi:hypothetical protein